MSQKGVGVFPYFLNKQEYFLQINRNLWALVNLKTIDRFLANQRGKQRVKQPIS